MYRGKYMPEVVRDMHGNIIRRSRNLAGIRAHAARHAIKKIGVSRNLDGSGGGRLCVLFVNGDSYETNFADYGVMCRHFLASRRSWYSVPLEICGKPSHHLLLDEAIRTNYF